MHHKAYYGYKHHEHKDCFVSSSLTWFLSASSGLPYSVWGPQFLDLPWRKAKLEADLLHNREFALKYVLVILTWQ
ncbi:655_t:CDS:2 [Cetraspora pellucida]|uniref:655_t:CDS:1 n=1 Tax=Cetraspora pellucida TaxID=1433469 RepID=A0A9N9C404_9GLOM|nr:655_t:CDS:2 [Cetraspora pellucida]